MAKFDVKVQVWLKKSVFDPQGDAVEKALQTLGHDGVEGVRIGKYMELQVEAPNEEAAREKVTQICDEVLCNPVMETYAFTLKAGAAV